MGVASGWDSRKGLEDIVKVSEITDAQIVIVGVTDEKNVHCQRTSSPTQGQMMFVNCKDSMRLRIAISTPPMKTISQLIIMGILIH